MSRYQYGPNEFIPNKLTLMDIWQNATLGNGNVSEEFVQLFVISDCKLEMARNNTRLFIIASGVASQFKDFRC